MKCLFIINPVAGLKIFQKKLNLFIGDLILKTHFHTIDTFTTKKKNDAYIKVASLKEKQYDLLVCVGGDGTLNEVISGLVESKSNIPISLLPSGSVNDFATYLNLPKTPDKFIEMINHFHIEYLDVGMIQNQCFINVLSGGMFSDIGFEVSREAKNKLGPLSYYLTALSKLPQELSRSIYLKIKADNHLIEEEVSLFLITNTSHVGGLKDITLNADTQDGLLDLFLIKKAPVTKLISLIKDYNFNTHLDNPMITYIQAKDIEIHCDQSIIYDIDGEKGEGFPIHVTCLKHAIPFIVPKNKS